MRGAWIAAARVRRHVVQDRVEQRGEVAADDVRLGRRPAVQPRRVDHREVELGLGRVQLVEQVEGRVDDVVDPRPGPVDLVDDDDRLQPQRQRLLRHEPRLRHRPLERVDQQADRVDHLEHALDLAAEVGVARRVNDVDARPLPGDRGELGQDGDAALALEVVRIHRAVGDHLARPELPRLAQEAVDQRRLAVIDVGDDGDVADVTSWHPADVLSLVHSLRSIDETCLT